MLASLTNGGPVKGKDDAANSDLPLPPAQTGPVTPAGMRPSTQSTEIKSGVPDTPEMQAAQSGLRSASQGVDQAQENVNAIQGPEARVRAQEEAMYASHLQNIEAKRQNDYAQEVSNERWKRDKAQAAYDLSVSKGVDPSKYYSKKGLLGTFATALSVISGGFLAGFKGGQNQALEEVDKGIDREVHAQEEDIANKKNQAETQDNHFQLFLKEGMDRQQAAAATQTLLRQDFAKQLDAKYHATSDAMGKLALQQAKQANAQKMAESEQNYAKLTANQITQKLDQKWQAASGGGGNDRAEYLKYAKKREDEGKPVDSYGVWHQKTQSGHGGDGDVKPGTGKVSPRLGVRLSAVQNATSTLDNVEKIEDGGWGPFGTAQAKGAGAVAQARSAMLEAGVDPGAVNTVFPEGYNPSDMHVGGKFKERIRQAREMVEHQKRVIQGAVDMSQGGGTTEPDEGGL